MYPITLLGLLLTFSLFFAAATNSMILQTSSAQIYDQEETEIENEAATEDNTDDDNTPNNINENYSYKNNNIN